MIDNAVTRVIAQRRSVRKYVQRQLTQEELDTILTCGFMAPTGMNTQPWFVSVIQDPEVLARMTEVTGNYMRSNPNLPPHLKKKYEDPNYSASFGAPTLMIVSSSKPQGPTDASLLAENMVLAAQSIGLGTCILGSILVAFEGPENADLKAKLCLPEGCVPVFGIAVGEPAEQPEASPREAKYVII